MKGVDDQGLSTGLAGIVGVVVTFGIGLLLFVVVGRRKATGGERDAAAATASSGSAP